MREVFAKEEIKTRVFSGENQEAGNCCRSTPRAGHFSFVGWVSEA